MGDEAEKKRRTTAKRKFTRCHNRLNTNILNEEDKDIVNSKFEDLKVLWDEVQSAHDSYLFTVYADDADEITKEDDEWLADVEERFEVMRKLKYDYIRSLELKQQNDKIMKTEQKMAEESNENITMSLKKRNASKLLLQQEIKGIEELIKMDKSNLLKSQILVGVKDVKLQLEKCKELHSCYVSYLRYPETENKWIEEIYSLYEKLNHKVYQYVESVTEKEEREKRDIGLKMERLNMTIFEV